MGAMLRLTLLGCLCVATEAWIVGGGNPPLRVVQHQRGRLMMFDDGRPSFSTTKAIVTTLPKWRPPPLKQPQNGGTGQQQQQPQESSDEQSLFACEVSYGDDSPLLMREWSSGNKHKKPLCWDASLDERMAEGILTDAAALGTVPRSALSDAMSLLVSKFEQQQGGRQNFMWTQRPPALQGEWALRCNLGHSLPDIEVDKHGYLCSSSHVSLNIGSSSQQLLIDTDGDSPGGMGLYRSWRSALSVNPNTQALEASFSEMQVGPLLVFNPVAGLSSELCKLPLSLQVFYVAKDVLGLVARQVRSNGQVFKEALLVFERQDKQQEEGVLSSSSSSSSPPSSPPAFTANDKWADKHRPRAAPHATVKAKTLPAVVHTELAGKDKLGSKLGGGGRKKRPKKVQFEYEGKDDFEYDERMIGGYQGMQQYLEEEALWWYFVLAGRCILSFVRHHWAFSVWKSSLAVAVLQAWMEAGGGPPQ